MICLHTRNLKKKLALALSGLVLTTSLTLSALPAAEADKAIALLNDKGENAWKIGYIKASDSEQRVVIA